jgi:acyl-CoA synthetase (NDP forming)
LSRSPKAIDYLFSPRSVAVIGASDSFGNQAHLTIEDFIEYPGYDEETRIICAFVEGLKDGTRFFKLAEEGREELLDPGPPAF